MVVKSISSPEITGCIVAFEEGNSFFIGAAHVPNTLKIEESRLQVLAEQRALQALEDFQRLGKTERRFCWVVDKTRFTGPININQIMASAQVVPLPEWRLVI